MTDFQQQAKDTFDSLTAQGQQEVDALHSNARQLQRQLQSSYAQVHTLQDQLERAQNYIQALHNQMGAGPEGRAAPGQGMRLPRPVRTSSLTGSLRSPRSPGGSSTSSTTSSRRNSDFQVRIRLEAFTMRGAVASGCWLLTLRCCCSRPCTTVSTAALASSNAAFSKSSCRFLKSHLELGVVKTIAFPHFAYSPSFSSVNLLNPLQVTCNCLAA